MRDGRETKVPINARTGALAEATTPATWCSFDEAMSASSRYSGVGYVFSKDDPFFGVDLDGCLINGEAVADATAIIDTFATYCEISPSGNGVKLIGIGAKPGTRCRTNPKAFKQIEVYDFGRFFTVTGNVLPGSPGMIRDCSSELAMFYAEWFGDKKSKATIPPPPPITGKRKITKLSNDEVLSLVQASAQADKFNKLWRGDTSGHDNNDSSADMALCEMLAFWCRGDKVQIDQLFRASGLMRPKWNSKRGDTTYGGMTIDKAVAWCSKFYEPQREDGYNWSISKTSGGFEALCKLIDDTISGKRRPVQFPWPIIGGLTYALMPGTLTIICGNPGATKSYFLLQAAAHWVESGVPTAVLELEDGVGYHLLRVLAQRSGKGELTRPDWIEENPDEALAARDALESVLKRIGEAIHQPPREVLATHQTIGDWMETQAKAGARVLAVDPISIAAATEKQHMSDQAFVARAKRIAEDHDASVVLVTHPKKHAEGYSLDDVSGGASLTRFAHTVLWLKFMTDMEPHDIQVRTPMGTIDEQHMINRIMAIPKARNGRGTGCQIGYVFDSARLTFDEVGLVARKNKHV